MAPTLQEVLASRSNISNKVILTMEMLQNEDIVSICLSNNADKSREYSHLTLDDNLKKLILVKEDKMKLEVETDLMQKKSHIILGNGHMGVRMQDMVGKVKQVKYDNTKSVKCIIGDANIEDICHVPTHITSFFKLLGENLNSITDLKRWGESIGGITHPTVQYSSKGSRLGDHVEHYNFASVNLHHHGSIKQWNVRPGCDYIPSLQTMYNNQSGLNLKSFKGVCESTLTHRDMWFNPNIP